MKLGFSIGYSGAEMALPMDMILQAERLGYDSVWTAEAYGSDAISPLAYIAAKTERIRLGTGIIQLAARTPAATAMAAQTVDALAGGGRFILGLGVSGPQIVEGWYGQPWGKPYWRIRDYVSIMKKIFARDEPVSHEGREISLPFTGEGALGIGKPLMSILHTNPHLPIFLGSGGPANLRMAGELCDGLLPLGFVPSRAAEYRASIEEGFAKAGNGKGWDTFEIQTSVSVNVTDDVRGALRALKPGVALYVGGMGHKNVNFHKEQMIKRGYGEAAERIQELYLAGRKAEALEEVPDDFLDEGALIGPPDRIRERYRAWADSGVTGITVATRQPEALDLMAEVAEVQPVGASS
ncbi:MAG: LLM class F420-dependent oxidoreductase [Dehalococcoidia bacterium]|jgi:F420-dependent oxidoreductase-like protein|nr:LLM class F420-dependent oxidoreductase [Dehalococcoidia bacterium]